MLPIAFAAKLAFISVIWQAMIIIQKVHFVVRILPACKLEYGKSNWFHN